MADEETTTSTPTETGGQDIQGIPVDDQGMAIPEPENDGQTEAVKQEPTETEEQGSTQEQSEPVEAEGQPEQEQLEKFAKSKGLTLDSDNAIKAAKMAMNAEKLMHEKTVRASELEKATNITNDQVPEGATQEVVDNFRMRNLELKMDIKDWKLSNPDKLAAEAEMVKVLSDPVKKELVQGGYLSLDDVYNMAQGGSTEAVKSQGKREALESLAHKQTAAVPRGHAVNSAPVAEQQITSANVDQLVAQNDLSWFKANYDSINRAMAG